MSGQPQRQKSTGQKFRKFFLGDEGKKVRKEAGKLNKKGQELKTGLKTQSKALGKTAEQEADKQLKLAAGLGEEEKATLDRTRAVIDDSMKTRLEQLGAARLQDQRASGNSTLISDLEQDLAFQDQAQQAALAAVGGSPLGQATAAHQLAGGAGDAARTAAQARTREVGQAEGALLGSLGTIQDQDLATARIAQGVQIAQLQNAVRLQDDLSSGFAQLSLGSKEDLFRLQQAELDATSALKIADMTKPRSKGILGGLLAIGGAVAGGVTGGPAGATAGSAAGGALGGALEELG